MGWNGMVIIGNWYSKSTFGANNENTEVATKNNNIDVAQKIK